MRKWLAVAVVVGVLGMFRPALAQLQKTLYVEVVPTSATYLPVKSGGVIVYDRYDTSQRGSAMDPSGVSPCAVIDLSRLDIAGYFTFQFVSITTSTGGVPESGTTISVHWRGSNVDSEVAWAAATQNTIIDGVLMSGATKVGYDINDITGVTPFRYVRLEYEAGVTSSIPYGVLYVR